MRRGDFYDYENEPLLDENEEPKEVKQWNLFKNEPRKIEVGSTAESKFIDGAVRWLKLFTIFMTFLVVLGTAVISKATLLLMTSQIKKNVTRPYCYTGVREQFLVTLSEEERATWIWVVVFAYFVPEFGTFVRSVRILIFKSWDYPSFWEFFKATLSECSSAVGSALLAFVVFPELDVIKAAMLTNAVCFVPTLIAFFSRMSGTISNTFKMGLDIVALVAQGTALVIWPLVENKPILYTIPAAVLLISFGWWENYLSEKSGIRFISNIAKSNKEFQNRTYFIYTIIAPLKCFLFLATALTTIAYREGSINFVFHYFDTIFSSHVLQINEIEPTVLSTDFSYEDALLSGLGTTRTTNMWTPLSILLINVLCTYICYAFGKFACKILIQTFSFAFPINLTVPVLLTILIAMCGKYNRDPCAYVNVIPSYLFFNVPPMSNLTDFISQQYSWVWLLWLLSQAWITIHIWTDNDEKLASTEKLFFRPMYDAFLIDQSIAMNRRRKATVQSNFIVHGEEDDEEQQPDSNRDNFTRIYACATMWHETKEEMVAFLKSILRLDEDQCAHRIVRNYLQYNLSNYYELETHIHFDDAFVRVSQEDTDPHVNDYVLDLIDSVSVAASEVHATNVKIQPPIIYPTPYGGKLVWTLPGKTKMVAHLKDKAKIRAKKRWSQCMYMYYLLGYRIMDNDELAEDRIKKISENTFLLALDGDIDFQPQSVHLLVDYMKKNRALGAACGRIHPVGSGAMAWYQTFEYAVGHWLQKATEHVIGCVLCSPGCFSLFRACALMDDNVMAKYTTVSEEARHYVQYDQGEDRWLCTLLLQRGYRVEYSAASDSYTHCPEGFNEFYNQRRRWMPSTTANILDLLTDYKHIIKINDNISLLYMSYQMLLMIGTVIGPGSIFLMLVGAFVAAFKLDQWESFTWNIIPILVFVICCATCKGDTQLFLAGIISGIYGLVMMAVLIGIFTQIKDDGILAPTSLFFLVMAAQFVIAALLHPQEFYCLKYGVVYYVTVPSMYMLLVIYSIFNMNNVSWGTREVTVVPKTIANDLKVEEKPAPKKEQNKILSFFGNSNDNAGSFEISFASLFKLMCCTYDKSGKEDEILRNIQNQLKEVQQKLNLIERNQYDPQPTEPRKSKRPTTIHIEGSRASRLSKVSMRNSVAFPRKSVLDNFEEDEYDDDDSFMEAESDDVPENSWFYDGELINSEVQFIDNREKKFWEELIEKYLTPIDETAKKGKVSKDLKDLRDKMVLTFFMINALYVLVVFLLTLQKEILHVNWPINPKTNFTYSTDQNEILIQHTYLELEPIGFVFLVFFALLMVVQFFAMIIHRFGTYCQIMVNTVLDFSLFDSNNMSTMTEEKMLKSDPIKTFKTLIRLQGINDEEDEDRDAPVTRRNTAHFLALKKKKQARPVIEDLEKAFFARLERMKNGELKERDVGVKRETIAAIHQRRVTISRRKSQMQVYNPDERMAIDNEGYEEDFA